MKYHLYNDKTTKPKMYSTIQHITFTLLILACTHEQHATSAFTPFSSRSSFTLSSSSTTSLSQTPPPNYVNGSGIQLSDQKSWAKQQYQDTKEATAQETFLKHKAAAEAKELADKEAKAKERQLREQQAREAVAKRKAEELAKANEARMEAARARAKREEQARKKIESEKQRAMHKAMEERKAAEEAKAEREAKAMAMIQAQKDAARREIEERRAEAEERARRGAEAMAAIKKAKAEALEKEIEERKAAENARTLAIAEANAARKEAALAAARIEMEEKIAAEKARAKRIADAMAAMKTEANAVLEGLNGEGDFKTEAAALVEGLEKEQEENDDINAQEYDGDLDEFLPSMEDINRQLDANLEEKNIVEHNLPSIEFLNLLLDVAIKASKEAGQIIVSNLDSAEVSKLKANPRDLLTEIDPLCESTIRDIILDQFPDHKFLGEEAVDPGKDESALALENKLKGEDGDNSDFLWIVDPIDGTSNFVHGMPLCMPSIACAYKGQTIIGVIYDPHRDEVFTAIKDHGAQMNGKLIEVGKQATVGDAIVAMGSPPGEESMDMSLRGMQELMPKCRTIRMLGSAALMLAWVANGRLTAYWEYDLSSWDIAAGALLITEAGGKFTDLTNEDYSLTTRKICGSNGLVHDELIGILNKAGVE